jgi:hypothetical protein
MDMDKYTFEKIAISAYKNPFCVDIDEFYEDLKGISQISRFITRYSNGETINLRILINQTVSFFNVFDRVVGNELLFHKVKDGNHNLLKTLLLFLNLLDKNHNDINTDVDDEFKIRLNGALIND